MCLKVIKFWMMVINEKIFKILKYWVGKEVVGLEVIIGVGMVENWEW